MDAESGACTACMHLAAGTGEPEGSRGGGGDKKVVYSVNTQILHSQTMT